MKRVSGWKKGTDLNNLIINYFEKLFPSQTIDVEMVSSCIATRITEAQNDFLTAPFTLEEVKLVVFSMHKDKAPGEDGFNTWFYQKYWHVVGTEVIVAFLGWLEWGAFLEGLNNINIVLIPKKNQPESMKELWPISLCNVIYKVAAKVLASWLKTILPEVILENQSGFIEGRFITDNIVIVNEVMQHLKGKCRGKVRVAALKIDIVKAYYKME